MKYKNMNIILLVLLSCILTSCGTTNARDINSKEHEDRFNALEVETNVDDNIEYSTNNEDNSSVENEITTNGYVETPEYSEEEINERYLEAYGGRPEGTNQYTNIDYESADDSITLAFSELCNEVNNSFGTSYDVNNLHYSIGYSYEASYISATESNESLFPALKISYNEDGSIFECTYEISEDATDVYVINLSNDLMLNIEDLNRITQ